MSEDNLIFNQMNIFLIFDTLNYLNYFFLIQGFYSLLFIDIWTDFFKEAFAFGKLRLYSISNIFNIWAFM